MVELYKKKLLDLTKFIEEYMEEDSAEYNRAIHKIKIISKGIKCLEKDKFIDDREKDLQVRTIERILKNLENDCIKEGYENENMR